MEKKLLQIRLQHQISEILWRDNGVSSHFDYHVNMVSESQTIKLNLLTYNPKHDEYMLLHSTNGASSVDCLQNMVNYLREKRNTEEVYTFTFKWKKKGEAEEYTSYFRANSKEEASVKFLHEKDANNYDFTVEMNPVS